MVLLRRRAPGEMKRDYPIFMAVADKIGHDRRGNTIYKRNPDGTEMLQRQTKEATRLIAGQIERHEVVAVEPIVDDELDDVAESYIEWLAEHLRGRQQARAI